MPSDNLPRPEEGERVRRALDAGGGEDGGFLLVRASTWGGQSVADVVWPGDLDNDFRPAGTTDVGGLPAAISGLVSLAASGFPSFGSDTGGYLHAPPDKELFTRWFEHSALSTVMQIGNNAFVNRYPAELPISGDIDDTPIHDA